MSDLATTILLLGAIHGFVLFLIFLVKKPKQKIRKYISSSILLISLALLFAYLELKTDYTKFPHFINISTIFSNIFLPFLYLYIREVTFQPVRKKIILFIPFFVHFLYFMIFFINGTDYKTGYYDRIYVKNLLYLADKIEILYLTFFSFLFSFLSYMSVYKYQVKVKKNAQNNDKKQKRKWLYFLSLSMMLLSIVSLTDAVLQSLNIHTSQIISLFSAYGSTIIIYAIGYFAMFHYEIITYSVQKPTQNSFTTIKNNDKILEKIIADLEQNKTFLDPELTLSKYSKHIQTASYIVSRSINSNSGLNFQALINKYRIEEFKKIVFLSENKNESIINLAYSVGFNTKSAFYTHFKTFTGLTPTEYINKHKNK
ncbi:MAG: AraC family transcriptional regulator [Bacteroidales bacterium]|nr:AraC family transcriptional regulator [Bacteroidales bacterium]